MCPESASCDQQGVGDTHLASTFAHEHGIEVAFGDIARQIGRKFRQVGGEVGDWGDIGLGYEITVAAEGGTEAGGGDQFARALGCKRAKVNATVALQLNHGAPGTNGEEGAEWRGGDEPDYGFDMIEEVLLQFEPSDPSFWHRSGDAGADAGESLT